MGRILVKDQDEFEAVFLTRDEAEFFLSSIKEIGSEHYTLFLTLLRTGMRRAEALDFDGATFSTGRVKTIRTGLSGFGAISRMASLRPQRTRKAGVSISLSAVAKEIAATSGRTPAESIYGRQDEHRG